MIVFIIIVLSVIGFNIYFNTLEEYIRRESIKNKINTYSKQDAIKNTNVKFWYKKSFTREFHKYIYDLSPFDSSLWIVSIIDRKSFNRYLSIDQFNVIVVISSLQLVMLDKVFTKKELNHIHNFYKNFLNADKHSDLIWLLGLYKKNKINVGVKVFDNWLIETVVEGINSYFLTQHKYTLIYYLFELAEADNEISNVELNFIYSLAKKIGLSKKELNTITSLYYSNYIPYPEAGFSKNKNHSQRSYKKTKTSHRTSSKIKQSKLENALSIFNLDESASFAEIKKEYRNMVRKHHPDRVAHLGDEHVKKATDFFKRITVAYEYLESVKS